jgi:hypothetical protein
VRTSLLRFEFVEAIPRDLAVGTLYVSIPFTTAIHRCCCGCGREVVTPIAPNGWSLLFDGTAVSLDPSIGNWSFPCQSHYWIRRNRVEWAATWSKQQIQLARAAERLAHDRRGESAAVGRADHDKLVTDGTAPESWWARASKWLLRR